MKLYKRNAQGKPIFWEITDSANNKVIVRYGLVGTAGHVELLDKKLIKANEVQSRIKAKRKEGYKELSELHDNAPEILVGNDLMVYLNTYLPENNTTEEGFILPMLAKVLKDDKIFKNKSYHGQYKINGVRCIVTAEKCNDMFRNHLYIYHSREGGVFNLPFMDEIIDKFISKKLVVMMIEEGIGLDGELYLPGFSVNLINSFVKNDTLPQHNQLQFWWYDIVTPNMSYYLREYLRYDNCCKRHEFKTLEDHFNNKDRIVCLPDYYITDLSYATKCRDEFIKLGFEGLIIRNINSEYQFDKRNNAMLKYKRIKDGWFTIVDIVPEGVRTNLPKFVLRNDVNDALFEVTLNKPQVEQENILKHKEQYIKRLMFVEYRERSGVNNVPFHAKGVRIM